MGHRTCDLQVAGSSPGWASLRSGLGQGAFLCKTRAPVEADMVQFAGKTV